MMRAMEPVRMPKFQFPGCGWADPVAHRSYGGREFFIYEALKHHQGKVVPDCFGHFQEPGEVGCIVLEAEIAQAAQA